MNLSSTMKTVKTEEKTRHMHNDEQTTNDPVLYL